MRMAYIPEGQACTSRDMPAFRRRCLPDNRRLSALRSESDLGRPTLRPSLTRHSRRLERHWPCRQLQHRRLTCLPLVTKNRAGSADSVGRVIHTAAHSPFSQVFADMPLGAGYPRWIHAAYAAGLFPSCQTVPEQRFCPYDPFARYFTAWMTAQAKGPVGP